MPALLSVTVEIKNPDRLKTYIAQAPATMAPHGAKMVARGKISKHIDGSRGHHIEALFEFPTAEAIDAWYNSDAYQALIPLRDEAANITISVLDPI